MLQDHPSQLDSSGSNGQIQQAHHAEHFPSPCTTFAGPTVTVDDTAVDSSPPPSKGHPLRLPKSFLTHRNNTRSAEIPRQTIMKALASRPPGSSSTGGPLAASLTGLLSGTEEDSDQKPCNLSSEQLSIALATLQSIATTDRPLPSGRLPLQSPCFFHQRFDDAVNIDKVLQDVADDEWLSHSRLMQTATGVREVSKQLQRRPIKRAVRNIMVVTRARD